MKRPILVAVIGYIIGIIIGLYFKFSIVLLYLLIFLVTSLIKSIINFSKIIKFKIINKQKENIFQLLKDKKYRNNKKKKFSFYSLSRYLRYFKLILNRKVLITIMIFSCISNLIIIEKNKKYESFYQTTPDVEIIAKVISNVQEKEYKNTYQIKVIEINKFKKDVCLYLNTNKTEHLKYGQIIKIKGNYQVPDVQRNYSGFNYRDYLKTLNIYGTVTAKNIEVIQDSKENDFFFFVNKIREDIKQNARKYLDKETYSIYLGLLLGDTSNIENNIQEDFRNSNMSHILAISGMHITYIVIGVVLFFSKISGKKISKIICIIVLLFYVTITGFSPSIIRACSTAIIMLLGGIIHRKSDVWTSIALSLFIILVYNPFLIMNIGLQFSYMGTLGIILLNKNIIKILMPQKHRENYFKKNKLKIFQNFIKEQKIIKIFNEKIQKVKYNILRLNKKEFKEKGEGSSKIKQILAVSISAQIFILPLTLFHFNTLGLYFIITNLLLGLIIGPVIIIGFIFLVLLILNIRVFDFFVIPMKFGIKAILFITNISNMPLSKIYVRTPKIIEIILYYIIILILNFIYTCVTSKKTTTSYLRVCYMLQLIKYNYKKYRKKIITFSIATIFIISSIVIFLPKSLKIHFVDVGQGDSCFIETPQNKSILIDGGGSETGNFDVGKNTLLPYILDRGYTKIDYIFISHFDIDHVQRYINNIRRT